MFVVINLYRQLRFLVMQHINTAKHKENKERIQGVSNLLLHKLPQVLSGKSGFDIDLCRALVRADIPFHKASHSEFKCFLEKYTGKTIPHETTLRKISPGCYIQ